MFAVKSSVGLKNIFQKKIEKILMFFLFYGILSEKTILFFLLVFLKGAIYELECGVCNAAQWTACAL